MLLGLLGAAATEYWEINAKFVSTLDSLLLLNPVCRLHHFPRKLSNSVSTHWESGFNSVASPLV